MFGVTLWIAFLPWGAAKTANVISWVIANFLCALVFMGFPALIIVISFVLAKRSLSWKCESRYQPQKGYEGPPTFMIVALIFPLLAEWGWSVWAVAHHQLFISLSRCFK